MFAPTQSIWLLIFSYLFSLNVCSLTNADVSCSKGDFLGELLIKSQDD